MGCPLSTVVGELLILQDLTHRGELSFGL